MGRVTLKYLRDELGVDLQSDVHCFSSTGKKIFLPGGEELASRPFSEILNMNKKMCGIFHFAFLTRDFVSQIGFDNYVKTNKEILKIIDRALLQIEFDWIVSISSGAVFDFPGGKLSDEISKNPYGFLKFEEEYLVQTHARNHGATSVVGRLWGCTGEIMPVDRKYAISDFIYQALTTENINVIADYEVWRRYIDGQDFIRILHQIALMGKSTVVDSSGDLIEVGLLAKKIAERIGSTVSRPKISELMPKDLYYPSGDEMNSYLEKSGTTILGIDEQIDKTIDGHRRQLFSQ